MSAMQENKIKIHQATIQAHQNYLIDPEILKSQATLALTTLAIRIRHRQLAMQAHELEPRIKQREAFLRVSRQKPMIWAHATGRL